MARAKRAAGATASAPPPQGPRPALGAAQSWAYQLQRLDAAAAAASPYDVLVVDHAAEGETAIRSAGEINALKTKPDGTRRLVLAYVSIGEAESYRAYWDASWATSRPAWLLSENDDWPGNFAVRYWDPAWQAIVSGSDGAMLDQVAAAGFDGVYLDKCDVFDDLREREPAVAQGRTDMEGDMVAFIAAISRRLKARDPSFVVVMQNAEALTAWPDLVAAIDGIGKESLIFGDAGPEKRNAEDDINATAENLDVAATAGKRILVVEYLNDSAKMKDAAGFAQQKGYVLYVSPKDRKLARLNDPLDILVA